MKNENTDRAGPGKEDHADSPLRTLRMGLNRTAVNMELIRQGRDYLLLVTGGAAHVGAVAVWDSEKARGPVSVKEMSGHREGPLARDCAEMLGRVSGRTVVAVVGIHQDEATREEIETIVANVMQGARDLAATLESETKDQ